MTIPEIRHDVKLNFGEMERGIATSTLRNLQDDQYAAKPIELYNSAAQTTTFLSLETAENLRGQLDRVLELIRQNSAPGAGAPS